MTWTGSKMFMYFSILLLISPPILLISSLQSFDSDWLLPMKWRRSYPEANSSSRQSRHVLLKIMFILRLFLLYCSLRASPNRELMLQQPGLGRKTIKPHSNDFLSVDWSKWMSHEFTDHVIYYNPTLIDLPKAIKESVTQHS